MRSTRFLPESPRAILGRVLIIESTGGSEPTEAVRRWLESGEEHSVWRLPCAFVDGGPWAGVRDLFASLIPRIAETAPDLLAEHDYELLTILPELRKTMTARNASLTDLAPPTEQVRLYPADRARRHIHGLIDLLADWKGLGDSGPCFLVVEQLASASQLAREFFRELVRRRARQLQLALVVYARHKGGQELARNFTGDAVAAIVRLQEEAPATTCSPSAAEMRRLAGELEIGTDDPDELERRLPLLVKYWSASDDQERALHWQHEAFTRYTLRGFYADAMAYGTAALEYLNRIDPDNETERWRIINKLASCHCAVGTPELALHLVQQEALGKIKNPVFLSEIYYLLGILNARFLPNRDFRQAEEELERGRQTIEQADLPHVTFTLAYAFNRNGLAYVKHRQGYFVEAIELCRLAYEMLTGCLDDSERRLQKSILIYNIAQVYAITNNFEEALSHYTKAMEMDVGYSEYYNERGNVYFKMKRFQEARQDYEMAIRLSPPYPEVRSNLGQCLRAMGLYEKALAAYDISLDLDPGQPWVLVMRAECLEALDRPEDALASYDAALALEPRQASVRANRAVLKYGLGKVTSAVEDLDAAIALTPEAADLYQNRAIALIDLRQTERARCDLEKYLSLRPDAEDRLEIERRLFSAELQPGADSRTSPAAMG
jgi:tetratricopeptide (TPR) repeat protein